MPVNSIHYILSVGVKRNLGTQLSCYLHACIDKIGPNGDAASGAYDLHQYLAYET
jgi:hypothetical protein